MLPNAAVARSELWWRLSGFGCFRSEDGCRTSWRRHCRGNAEPRRGPDSGLRFQDMGPGSACGNHQCAEPLNKLPGGPGVPRRRQLHKATGRLFGDLPQPGADGVFDRIQNRPYVRVWGVHWSYCLYCFPYTAQTSPSRRSPGFRVRLSWNRHWKSAPSGCCSAGSEYSVHH